MLRKSLFTVGWLLAFVSAFAETRPIHTYSIVARNPINGDLGVAVQSHWFSVGSLVPWAEAGVGAVATQSFVDQSYGLLGLELMRGGKTARQALEALLAVDSGRAVRQVAMIDTLGTVGVHTGSRCIPVAGHESGEQFSVQANLMLNDKIWPAMATAYRQAQGELSDRMLAALEAAQAVGGDIRGKQSAAILVVSGKSSGKPWLDRKMDLRVEDHPEPLKELRRLVRIHQAYEHMNSGDLAVEKSDLAGALREYSAAEALNPENIEMKYWHAIGLANSGHLDESLPIFRTVFEADRNWVELTTRLTRIDLLKVNEGELKKILSLANDTR